MKKVIAMLFLMCFLFVRIAYAEVVTTPRTEGYGDYVYVAGTPDRYPIEFYDEDAEKYCGIIPDFLSRISEKTGIDFVYINGDKKDKTMLMKNLQVEIISSMERNEKLPNEKAYVELFNYKNGKETVKCGIVFAINSEEETIAEIKAAAETITAAEKNRIYLSYASEEVKDAYNLLWIAVVVLILLAFLVLFLVLRMKKIREKNEHDKFCDAETGIGNLKYFKYHFRHSIRDEIRNLYHIAYIVLDSSYLRSYHGDKSFEEVLKYTATVLSEYAADTEIFARITENDFAFLYQATNDEDAHRRIEELMRKLNEFEDGRERSNQLVFHCAMYRLMNNDHNCEMLFFNLRKNCSRIFGTDDDVIYCDRRSMTRVQEEKKIKESILEGFSKNEFKIYLQFIVDNKTKEIVSCEALSRWESQKEGLIYPGRYIGDMESAGLIGKHDLYMFELVCRQLQKWHNTEYGNISIFCNFTRITLSEEGFIDKIKMIAQGYEFDKSKLSIEITEDAMEKNREIAAENVKLCRELGFKIYLDDLGSGYTSLANLCEYPIDVVKIDRYILLKTNTKKGKKLFSGIIALAHNLGIKVVCEGVETQEHDALTSASDCDYIQGWYYSRAYPLEECEDFIDYYNKKLH